MKNKRVKKTRIDVKRVILCVVIIILLVIGLIILMGNSTTSSFVETKYKTFYVSSGETLWEIANIEAANNDYYADEDIRYIVKDIKILNNLKSSDLYPGQELLIPSI